MSQSIFPLSKLFIGLALTGLLGACGGGGGGGSSGTAPVASSSQPAPSSAPASSSSSPHSSSAPISSSVMSASVPASSSVASSIPATSSSVASSSGAITAAISGFIVVDQFGYLPDAQKIAVIRDPQNGYDASQSFSPGANLSLVNMTTGEIALTAAPVTWNQGATDTSSGDKAWWFDFSAITAPGTYAVVDNDKNVRSPSFKIAADVYKPVLKEAFRAFFYQRAGVAKNEPYAEAAWVDSASHIGANQDSAARLYSDKSNAATAKDLSGGWYDAGDYNKYTSWAADYVVTLLHAYIENPAAWGDDFNIPESGNGIPDIIDEAKVGLDWLVKMQNATGNNSVLSIVGMDGKSPPSATTGPSYYGSASTNATLSTAGAFAFASKVLEDLNIASLNAYSADLENRAENAWTWAVANPNVLFYNNDESKQPNSANLGAGQQETDASGRAMKKRLAAIYLFAATGKSIYRDFIDANYTSAPLKAWSNFADPFRETENTALLYYSNLSGATGNVATDIKSSYSTAMNGTSNWLAIDGASENSVNKDPYRAYLQENEYTWGSNSVKSLKGSMFLNLISFGINGTDATKAKNAGLRYINYLHGVNPQGKVYLSNMYKLGVHSSVNEFYHTWFSDGSARWDRVGTSTYGPAPGFLVGGPNPGYDWDGFCNSNPADTRCSGGAPTPPKGQPPQKAYKDFNTSWPINSWSVTENSNGYQSNYLRLLSKFVTNP